MLLLKRISPQRAKQAETTQPRRSSGSLRTGPPRTLRRALRKRPHHRSRHTKTEAYTTPHGHSEPRDSWGRRRWDFEVKPKPARRPHTPDTRPAQHNRADDGGSCPCPPANWLLQKQALQTPNLLTRQECSPGPTRHAGGAEHAGRGPGEVAAVGGTGAQNPPSTRGASHGGWGGGTITEVT